MAYTANPAKSGRLNLLDLINFTNSTTITNDQISVDTLTALAPEDIDVFGRNTSVHIAAIDNKGYINGPTAETGITLKYRRVGLTETSASLTTTFSIDQTTTYDGLRAVVAAANGWLVEDIEIEEQLAASAQGTDTIYSDYPDAGGGEGNIQILKFRPVSGSFLYVGAPVSITGAWVADDPDLGTVVTNHSLEGFVPVV